MSSIVVGIDGTREADRALQWACREAVLRHARIELVHSYVDHLGRVLHSGEGRAEALAMLDRVVDRSRAALESVKWDARVVGVSSVPSAGLLDAGDNADLIVVGTLGSGGFQRLRLGSTGYRVSRCARVPVAVVSVDGERSDLDGCRGLVVGVDDSPAAVRAVAWAVDEAMRRSATVELVHAIGAAADGGRVSGEHAVDDAAHGLLDRVLRGLTVPNGLAIERVVVQRPPAEALLRRATEDRLLVVGRQGCGGAPSATLGSVSSRCVHHASGPIVVVP